MGEEDIEDCPSISRKSYVTEQFRLRLRHNKSGRRQLAEERIKMATLAQIVQSAHDSEPHPSCASGSGSSASCINHGTVVISGSHIDCIRAAS